MTYSEQDLFASCVNASRGGPPSLGVDAFAASWKAMLRWLRSQVTSGNGGSVQGLGKILWCTTPAGGPPSPCFVLSERFLHLQLQLGSGITRSASVQRCVGSCEEVNFTKLALNYGQNLTRDQVATCIKATLHHLDDLVQQGAAVQLDLGVGSLAIRGGRADFCFRGGLQQAAADVGPTAAYVGGPLTAEAVHHLTDALGSSGFTTPARSTVSRVSAASQRNSDIFGTDAERASAATSYTTSSQAMQAGYNQAKAPPAPRSDSLPGGPGCMLRGETHAAAVARISQQAVEAAREGREAARNNAKSKPVHFILPVGGPGEEEDDEPRLRQGKGKHAGPGHSTTTNTILGEVPPPSSPPQQQGRQAARSDGPTVFEAAAAREAEHKQRLLAQQEKVLLGMAQRKAVLDEEAAALVVAQREKQKQLAADLALQIKSKQAAAMGAKTGAPEAGQEAPLLAGSLDSAGAVAKRHQQQVLYRAELESQMAAKEQVRSSTAAAERQQDQQRLAQVQEELVRSVQTTKDMAKQKQSLFRQQLDQQVATRGVRESFMD